MSKSIGTILVSLGVVIMALLLSACSPSAKVIPTADGSYMVSASDKSLNDAYSEATKSAQQLCLNQSKSLSLVSEKVTFTGLEKGKKVKHSTQPPPKNAQYLVVLEVKCRAQ